MITINLRDEHLTENMKAIEELRGILPDSEIQRMYEEQQAQDRQNEQ